MLMIILIMFIAGLINLGLYFKKLVDMSVMIQDLENLLKHHRDIKSRQGNLKEPISALRNSLRCQIASFNLSSTLTGTTDK